MKKYIYSNHNIVNSLDIYKKTNLEKQKGQKNRSAYHQVDACHGSDIIDIIIPTAAKVKTQTYKNNDMQGNHQRKRAKPPENFCHSFQEAERVLLHPLV